MKLSPCGELVRAGDPVRFRTALFAPPGLREHLFALYAFNLEIAKIAPMVSEPMLGEIRLQWWREAIETAFVGGVVRQHEVVRPLNEAICAARLPRAPFDALIDARASDLDPAFPEDQSALHRYIANTAGGLALLGALALTPVMSDEGRNAARDAGFAIGAMRYLLAVPEIVARGGKPLPMEMIDSLAAEGRVRLNRARTNRRSVPSAAAPALLEAASAYHALTSPAARSLFRERLSLFWRGTVGRW